MEVGQGDRLPAPVKLHFIWTRDIDADRSFGRLKMAHAIRAALSHAFSTQSHMIRSIMSTRSPSGIVRALGQYARSVIRLKPLPLQCILFADTAEADRLIGEIPIDATAVYIDGARCVTLLHRLRRKAPGLAIITDLDDLMSRRMRLLLALGEAPSTGYMKGSMPGFVEAILRSRFLARLLLRYEAATLRAVERDVVRLSDRAVLVSSEDARLLSAQTGDAAKVVGIAPPAPLVQPAAQLLPGQIRFVFVGSDTLRQNQLTIDKLLALWRTHGIVTPLVIYGEQTRNLDLPPQVSMPGYASTIEEIYDGRSVLLSPSYLAGGIKTKVLEAFGYGTAVLGNSITFEGIDITSDYPMSLESDAAMVAVLSDPEGHRRQFHEAAVAGSALISRNHDPARFAERWAALVRDAVAERSAARTQASAA